MEKSCIKKGGFEVAEFKGVVQLVYTRPTFLEMNAAIVVGKSMQLHV